MKTTYNSCYPVLYCTVHITLHSNMSVQIVYNKTMRVHSKVTVYNPLTLHNVPICHDLQIVYNFLSRYHQKYSLKTKTPFTLEWIQKGTDPFRA